LVEQRRAQRFALKLPLEVLTKNLQRGAQPGETRNLSSGGVLFKSNTALTLGENVEYVITFPTPPEANLEVRLRCVGKVVRFSPDAEVAATLERYEFIRKSR
jgi:hypothetical protein